MNGFIHSLIARVLTLFMNLDRYAYETKDNLMHFEFYSHGPKGNIRKAVQFMPNKIGGFLYFNLSFGDWSEETKRIDDFIVTNNLDAECVLATVASAVVDFTNQYPNAIIYAKGSTDSRTRLYQMGISKYCREIEHLFDVFGFNENEGFKQFQRGVNYHAFVVKRRK